MGVALPPRSVPSDSAQASTDRSMPCVAAMDCTTGTMVAANGMLSISALHTADSSRMMRMTTLMLPPLMVEMNCAMSLSTPVCSSPATEMNRPMKNSSVL